MTEVWDFENGVNKTIAPTLPSTKPREGTDYDGWYNQWYNGIALYIVDTDFCSKSPPVFLSWGDWSSCNRVCGNGTRTRRRSCHKHCWKATSKDLSQKEVCIEKECDECGKLFPFGLNSNESKSVIENLVTHHDYNVALSETG